MQQMQEKALGVGCLRGTAGGVSEILACAAGAVREWDIRYRIPDKQ